MWKYVESKIKDKSAVLNVKRKHRLSWRGLYRQNMWNCTVTALALYLLTILLNIYYYFLHFSALLWPSLDHFCCKTMQVLPLFSTQWADEPHSLYIRAKIKDLNECLWRIPHNSYWYFRWVWPQSSYNPTTEQQYHQVGKLLPASPFCNNYANCIHLRDLICPPFGQVPIYNTLYIMFSPHQFSKGPE